MGPTRVAKAEKNLLYQHDKPMNQPRKENFHLYSLSPHSHQVQKSAEATPSSLSGFEQETAPTANCDLRNTVNSTILSRQALRFRFKIPLKTVDISSAVVNTL